MKRSVMDGKKQKLYLVRWICFWIIHFIEYARDIWRLFSNVNYSQWEGDYEKYEISKQFQTVAVSLNPRLLGFKSTLLTTTPVWMALQSDVCTCQNRNAILAHYCLQWAVKIRITIVWNDRKYQTYISIMISWL